MPTSGWAIVRLADPEVGVTKIMKNQKEKMSGFYRIHARIYEATRWTFLFGRKEITERLKLSFLNEKHLLEIGCGTGHNLAALADRHPNMKFTGVDISPVMLAVAEKMTARFSKKITLLELIYGQEMLPILVAQPDIVLISYCLDDGQPGLERRDPAGRKGPETGRKNRGR